MITDWKTNKEKNMEINNFTKPMKKPFENLPNNALGHYNTQLPFYGKLLLKMLEGSKYGSPFAILLATSSDGNSS